MIRQYIYDQVILALDKLGYVHEQEITIEIPNNIEFGDYSTNAAMILAKDNKLAPKVLAEELVKN